MATTTKGLKVRHVVGIDRRVPVDMVTFQPAGPAAPAAAPAVTLEYLPAHPPPPPGVQPGDVIPAHPTKPR